MTLLPAAVVHSGIVVAGAAEVLPGVVVDAAVQEGAGLGNERAAAAAPDRAEVAEVWYAMHFDFVTMGDSAPVGLAAAEADRSDFVALVGTLHALVAGTVDRLPEGSAERCEPGLA